MAVKVFMSSVWLEKNNGGWGSITILRGNSRKCLQNFFSSELLPVQSLEDEAQLINGRFPSS